MKWPHQAPKSRRSAAEALTTVTIALATRRRGAPDQEILRRALFAWAFNPGTRNLTPPADIAAALDWIAAASQPVTALEDPDVIRAALGACARTQAGAPAAATTQRRKRAVFYNAVGHAVELRLLAANPVDRVQWKAPVVAETVDRRVVVSPAQARALLAGVRAQGPRGEHLEAFFGCLYYAALRPSEAVAPLHVQRAELSYGLSSPDAERNGMYRIDFDDPALDWQLADGDTEIASGVAAVLTAGHTPGHQSFIVEYDESVGSGGFVFAFDAADLTENIEGELPVGSFIDCEAADTVEPIRRLKTIARERGLLLVPGHDPVAWPRLTRQLADAGGQGNGRPRG